MKPFSGPDYRKNAARCGELDPCVCCGRAIWNREKAVSVEVCCCGQFMEAPGHQNCQAGSQGAFLLGPDCAKKYRLVAHA